jgi:hypothetical protein
VDSKPTLEHSSRQNSLKYLDSVQDLLQLSDIEQQTLSRNPVLIEPPRKRKRRIQVNNEQLMAQLSPFEPRIKRRLDLEKSFHSSSLKELPLIVAPSFAQTVHHFSPT